MATLSRLANPRTASLAALVVAAFVAGLSIGVAAMRDQDRASVAAPPTMPSRASLIADTQQRLAADPGKAEDWRALGWLLFEERRLAEAAAAYRRATELEPGKAENWSSYGEALQVAVTDVSPDAAAAFRRALELDPADPRARYFLAVQKDLRGEHAAAVDEWLRLLKDTPPGAVWEADLRHTITQVAERHGIDLAGRLPPPPVHAAAGAAIPGPTREQMVAAASLPPGEQSAMVEGMVDRLADRLASTPRDEQGWVRLMRSHMVLRRPAEAAAALRSALAAFADDPAAQERLRSQATELGVPKS